MRNSETLRSALFEQIKGLQDGSVKPETAKATASCAMAICKTVELDLRATELFKDGGDMKPLQLTNEAEATAEGKPVSEVEIIAEDQIESIMKGHKLGLPVATIASRLSLSRTDVELVIEARRED